jgi:hypothetical protein
MAINLDKMKAKLTTLNEKAGGNNNFWRPQDGNQTIRILPTADEDPFKTFHFHYNIGKSGGILCLNKNFGEDCPACNLTRELYREGDEGSVRMAKDFTARQRFFSPVLVRGEESEGPKIWGYGKKVYETLLQLVLNPEYGDITDPDAGTDLDLQYGKPAGASFPQTNLTPKRRTTPMCTDISSAECQELLEKIPDFDGLFEKKSAEDIRQLVQQAMTEGADAEEVSSETRVTATTTEKKVVEATSESGKKTNVDDAFDDLMSA